MKVVVAKQYTKEDRQGNLFLETKLEECDITGDLKSLQKIVDGYIEVPFISRKIHDKDIMIVLNEEGRFTKKPSISLESQEDIIDYLYGDILFIGDSKDGDFTGLNDEQIEFLKNEVIDNNSFDILLEDGVCIVTQVLKL